MAWFKKLFVVALTLALGASCVSNKRIIYLQNLEGNEPIADGELITYELPEYRLQFNDILDINVKTAEDMIKEGFGFKDQTGGGGNRAMIGQIAQTGGDIYYMTGFTVDRNGSVRLPLLGEVSVMQMTLDEARLEIESRLREYVKSELYVTVKLGGIRFSSLGEFRRPGKHVVLQDRMTIFEAIAQSGDLTNVAKRDELLIIRQYPDGTRLHRVNLNDRHIVHSPFYFIQPNDQLYAEPMKVREVGAGENASQTLALLVSSISAFALILNLVTR
ncbi:MAG: polysaccharide biosynthesis/export family protein [Lunatimonas sp.]|uniref:polysaccharide biosynthesis/export family protein n=1 Tax=Lunatimonas sp. TaxID=2060141 RepID=UPI00263AF6B4|nr:polysaccharide biosynthesis/export family protein [Lunatimonas sp.]MCC5936798.1 polysaccharide biosynthesis/export family protein [Lunatimonas sp.]